jgi:hypothetical protein
VDGVGWGEGYLGPSCLQKVVLIALHALAIILLHELRRRFEAGKHSVLAQFAKPSTTKAT